MHEATESVRRSLRSTVETLGDLRATWRNDNRAMQSYWDEFVGSRPSGLVHLSTDERRRLSNAAARLEEEAELATEDLGRIKHAAGALAHALGAVTNR
jgi:hypothetical protein